jgi:hypothetical protein
VLHTAPTDDESGDYYLWHLQILPRIGSIAGFELGSGISITTGLPEETAGMVRTLVPRTFRFDVRRGRAQRRGSSAPAVHVLNWRPTPARTRR